MLKEENVAKSKPPAQLEVNVSQMGAAPPPPSLSGGGFLWGKCPASLDQGCQWGRYMLTFWDTAFRLPERNQEAEAMGGFMVEVNC